MPAIGTTRAEDDFFQAPKDWSEQKHKLLVDYLRSYLNIRGSYHSAIYYIDGYAGSGIYGADTANESAGSPVLVAQIAEDVAESTTRASLRCIAIEYKADRYRTLCAALASFPKVDVQPLHGDFATYLPSILESIGTAPAFFFLDPFGVKDIRPGSSMPCSSAMTPRSCSCSTPRGSSSLQDSKTAMPQMPGRRSSS